MESALAQQTKTDPQAALRHEIGPIGRSLAERYFEPVRFSDEIVGRLRALHEQGFVVHVQRSSAWVNYLFTTWALVRHGLPPVRAVVNLRRWFTKPWRRTAQRGDFDVRFTYARRNQGSALIFLKQTALLSPGGRYHKEDPFPALVAFARKTDRPVFLVPEIFVWEKKGARLRPSVLDRVFGTPEVPGFLHSMLAYWRNYKRAQFRVGEPINLTRFLADNPDDPEAVLARKVRSALHQHLARESRAVFGPPLKPTSRVIEETMRDRAFRKSLEQVASTSKRPLDTIEREARKNLKQIAAKLSPATVAIVAPIMGFVFNRIYDGIEVDERGLDRAMSVAARAPVVLCPSHKSHIDYLLLSYVLWTHGYQVPYIAAGANLSFFPLGGIFRRSGAFFLRRSFKGDKVYTYSFKAYIKKLVHDGVHQEFFPEGGRSRTGKLLMPKLGMLAWEVEAVLEGAARDLHFVPVSIDYEKVVESGSYSKELAGGEKKPEDLKALITAPKVLTENYGRIHLNFDAPISVVELARSRGIDLDRDVSAPDKKALIRMLGNRIMFGISRVSTVTPHALASSALLAHRRRGISARKLTERIGLLRKIAAEEGAPVSKFLENAPSDPTALGPVKDAIRTFCQDDMVRIQEAKGEPIYQVADERRAQLAFYKNTLMNLVTPRSLVANAMLAAGLLPRPIDEIKERALWLSRLFKLEFIYKVGATFDEIFAETVEHLVKNALLERRDDMLAVVPEPHGRAGLEFLADLMRDYLESYLIAALALEELAEKGPIERKAFLKTAMDTGRAEFLSGRIGAAESLSRTTLENAIAYMVDQGMIVESDKKLKLTADWESKEKREEYAREIRAYLNRRAAAPHA